MSEKTIRFLKTRNVKSPSRAHEHDAGIDFYVPKYEDNFLKDLKDKNPKIFTTQTCNINSCVPEQFQKAIK
jgi:hypothetical protein